MPWYLAFTVIMHWHAGDPCTEEANDSLAGELTRRSNAKYPNKLKQTSRGNRNEDRPLSIYH